MLRAEWRALQFLRPRPRREHRADDLKPGDLISAGRVSNYGARASAAFVYLTATLDAATWGAELAIGHGPGRIYIVEPTGPIEDDPNLTDKKFPGNPTCSYRTPARVVVFHRVAAPRRPLGHLYRDGLRVAHRDHDLAIESRSRNDLAGRLLDAAGCRGRSQRGPVFT